MSIAAFDRFALNANIQDTQDRDILLKRTQKTRTTEKPGFTGRAKELTDDSGTISNVAKLAKSTLGLLAGILKHLPWLGIAAKVFADTADVIKIFATGKDIDDIAKSSKALNKLGKGATPEEVKAIKEKRTENGLKVASCTLDLASIGLTGAKLVSATKLVDVGAKIAAGLGKIPFIGQVAAVWAPLGSIAAFLTVVKSSVDIAQGARKIIALKNQKSGDVGADKENLANKKAKWAEVAENGIVSQELKDAKVNKLNQKIQDNDAYSQALEARHGAASQLLKDTDQAALDAKKLAAGKSPLKIAKKVKAAKAERQAKKATNAYAKLIASWDAAQKRTAALNDELTVWDDLDLGNVDAQANVIKPFAERKIEKYDIKLKNNRWNVIKEAVGISLNSVLIIASIAAIVLTGLAIVSSFAMLPLAAAFLAVSVIGITLHFLKKRQDEKYQGVSLNQAIA